jgi:hypothetical protein
VAEGEAMKDDEFDYETFEEWMVHYMKVIATELTKIRKEINYANTKEK